MFRLFHDFGILPNVGGYNNQDPFVMDLLLSLHEVAKSKETIDAREFEARLAGVKIGAY